MANSSGMSTEQWFASTSEEEDWQDISGDLSVPDSTHMLEITERFHQLNSLSEKTFTQKKSVSQYPKDRKNPQF